MREWKKQE